MRDDLLGYLLGALEPEQEREIEARLETDEQLRRELREHRKYLQPLGTDSGLLDAPRGLARRVCDTVADHRDTPTLSDGEPRPGKTARNDRPISTSAAAPMSTTAPGTAAAGTEFAVSRRAAAVATDLSHPPPERRWGWAEAMTVGSIVAAASLLIVPALSFSRYRSQIEACRERMHVVGHALVNYSRAHGGTFPEIEREGPLSFAGVYALRLQQAKLIVDPSDLHCPGRTAMPMIDAAPTTLEDLRNAKDESARRGCLRATGDFGYSLGYVEAGVYHPARNLSRGRHAVLADAPAADGQCGGNHGCGGQNVWFEDGHAEYLCRARLGDLDDQLFLNRAGYVGAGIGADDVVIGAPDARPLIRPAVIVRPTALRD